MSTLRASVAAAGPFQSERDRLSVVVAVGAGGSLVRIAGAEHAREPGTQRTSEAQAQIEVLVTALEVGVAEAMVLSSKSTRLKSMFGPTKGGFRWVTLKISGPAAVPTDNFQELFSATEQSTESNSRTTEPSKASFEELTRPRK